jgi:hypothetical protein
VGYGERSPSGVTTTPPAIWCKDLSNAATAAEAIGDAAFPTATIRIRRSDGMFSDPTACDVAAPGSAPAIAASYNERRTSGDADTRLAAITALGMRKLVAVQDVANRCPVTMGSPSSDWGPINLRIKVDSRGLGYGRQAS